MTHPSIPTRDAFRLFYKLNEAGREAVTGIYVKARARARAGDTADEIRLKIVGDVVEHDFPDDTPEKRELVELLGAVIDLAAAANDVPAGSARRLVQETASERVARILERLE